METIENVIHDVNVYGVCISYTNYQKSLPLVRNYLGMIYTGSDKSTFPSKFQKLFMAVRYVNPNAENDSCELILMICTPVRSDNKKG